MTQEFLGGLQVGPSRSQVGRQRVTEAVPSDFLPSDVRPDECRANDLLQNHVGRHRSPSLIPNRWKEEVILPVVRRFLPPGIKAFDN
jgi:hypothetical protein